MSIAALIAEYDPFHAGHAWQLAELRRRGFDQVAVALSGPVVQRGTLALLPAPVRAAAALEGGASLVVGIPAPWACQSAEGFAAAGVALLSALPGTQVLAFGAETPDGEALMNTARALLAPEFGPLVREQLADGRPFAAARAVAAQCLYPPAGEILASPNNNLGVEYCKAILAQNSHLVPLPLPRLGAAHGADAPAGGFASASYIRACLLRGDWAEAARWLPAPALARYQAAAGEGQMTDPAAFSVAVLSRLRAREDFSRVRGAGEGLDRRLAAAVHDAPSLTSLYERMKTKRYAHARLRRLVLDAALGYDDQLPALPPYLHVWGAAPGGMALLKGAALPAGASMARLEAQSPACRTAAQAHSAACDLAALCRCRPAPMGLAYTQPMVRGNTDGS